MHPTRVTRWTVRALLVLLVSISSSACVSAQSSAGAASPVPESLSPEETPFPPFDPDFQRYRATLAGWLAQRSMGHRTPESNELNLPFELAADPSVDYRGRFLLLHGLNDSPYVWRNFAIELADRGFDVRAVLFEGHGTTPRDMLHVQWESWLTSARDHLAAWRAVDDESPIYLGGFSMGAVLATWLALDNPDIAGLLLISPAFESKLNRYLRWSGVYARFRPWVFGGMILEDNPIKYNSIPVNSGWQYFQLTRALKRRWRDKDKIDIPTLFIMSDDDSVVNTRYTRTLFTKRFVADRRLLLSYSNEYVQGSAEMADAHEMSRVSAYPERRILSQSHLGLMYSPRDPLFGEQGSILVCNGNEYPVFMACMRSSQHWYGAQHAPSPDSVPVARTTYNPDWSGVLELFEEIFLSPDVGTVHRRIRKSAEL